MNILAFITSFFETNRISILEAIMLICWGLSWPVSVIKALRTKIVHGKSPLFMSLIAVGYLCGILNKVLYSRDYLILLYIFNLLMILTDLYLYARYNLRLVQKDPKILNKKLIPMLDLAKNNLIDSMEQKQYTSPTHQAGQALRPYDLPTSNTIRDWDRKEDFSLNGNSGSTRRMMPPLLPGNIQLPTCYVGKYPASLALSQKQMGPHSEPLP